MESATSSEIGCCSAGGHALEASALTRRSEEDLGHLKEVDAGWQVNL